VIHNAKQRPAWLHFIERQISIYTAQLRSY
jgi:hypothetical protein